MKFFLHSSNARREICLLDIQQKYGYHGVGVFWCMVEHVVSTDGTCTAEELIHMFQTRKYGRKLVIDLLSDYGCFVQYEKDGHRFVKLADHLTCASTTYIDTKKQRRTKDTAGDTAGDVTGDITGDTTGDITGDIGDDINTRAYNKNKINNKNKKKEKEEKKESLTPTSISSNDLEKPEVEGVHKAAGERMLCNIFNDLYEAKNRFDLWYETVCKRFGYDTLLNDYWSTAIGMLKDHMIIRGKWNTLMSTEDLLKYASSYLLEWENTHTVVLDELKRLRQEKLDEERKNDFMSTYKGPPIPEDAPPRPSHTAYFNFSSYEWDEPRNVKEFEEYAY